MAPEVSPVYLDDLFALVKYQPPIDKLIFDYKYQGVKGIGLTLGKMIYYAANIPKVDLITYVPLSIKKQKSRGFNQAQIIAQELSRLTDIHCRPLLVRKKSRKAQASILDKGQRIKNASDLYLPIEDVEINKVSSVLMIDDVSTTGATLNECAKVLKQMGIKKVYGLSFAHG